MIGRTLGKYRVEKLLGAGGMAVVYLAEHVETHHKVALKTLLPALANDAELVSRFVGEARAASEIENPHIVDVLELGSAPEADGRTLFFYAMEHLPGETLTQRMGRGALSISEAVSITRQCCDALGASHRRGIVHRDIKPGNIFLVDKDGRSDFVKVVDFGIARLLDPTVNPAAAHRTRTGALLGTPAYMAPEQGASRAVVDARTDVYALGVVLYQMLAGRLPFVQRALLDLVRAHRTLLPDPPSTHRPAVPPALDAIVLRALAKSPADRFQTMEELDTELAAVEPSLPATGEGGAAFVPLTERPTVYAGGGADQRTVYGAPVGPDAPTQFLAEPATVHLTPDAGDAPTIHGALTGPDAPTVFAAPTPPKDDAHED